MYQIKINGNHSLQVANDQEQPIVNQKSMNWDMQQLPDGSYHIIADGKSYKAMLLGINKKEKTISLKINNNTYDLSVQEPIDLVLEKMGLNTNVKKKAESLKAPMPGLILKILVEEGQAIQKGEPILILEAMKMENVFKAASDATVKQIKVTEGQAVEKGAVLIELA